MKINVTRAKPILHQLLRRCATERVILTRRGRPICWLQPFPKTRQESDAELLRSVFEFVPYGRGGLVLDLDILAQPTAGKRSRTSAEHSGGIYPPPSPDGRVLAPPSAIFQARKGTKNGR